MFAFFRKQSETSEAPELTAEQATELVLTALNADSDTSKFVALDDARSEWKSDTRDFANPVFIGVHYRIYQMAGPDGINIDKSQVLFDYSVAAEFQTCHAVAGMRADCMGFEVVYRFGRAHQAVEFQQMAAFSFPRVH